MFPNRLFLIEPNLIKAAGHVIEYPLSLQRVCRQKGIDFYLFTNKKATQEVLRLIKPSFPLISNTCFESLSDNKNSFYQDLRKIHQQFHFNESDLVVIPTCYTNEIKGTYLLSQNLSHSELPHMALNFHQLFPPAPDLSVLLSKGYQKTWLEKLKKASESLDSAEKISFWTTPSTSLNKSFEDLATRRVGRLPVPFTTIQKLSNCHFGFKESKGLKFAFLGDGRSEKGLLLFLFAIQKNEIDSSSFYVIQSYDPRGYRPEEKESFCQVINQLEKRRDTFVIQRALEPREYQRLIQTVDVLVLPYHPQVYDKRISGIFVQAVMYQKPVIVSSQSWMAKEIKKGNASGVIFEHPAFNQKKAIKNLQMAIKDLSQNFKSYKELAKFKSQKYQAFHNADTFLEKILGYYKNYR